MSARKCETCGAPLEEGVCFCASCGTRLGGRAVAEEPVADPVPDEVVTGTTAPDPEVDDVQKEAEKPLGQIPPMHEDGVRLARALETGMDVDFPGMAGNDFRGGKVAHGRKVRLDIDRMCVFFTGWQGEIRMRLTPARPIENVEIVLENARNPEERYVETYERLGEEWEIYWSIDAREAEGADNWTVRLAYDLDGGRERWIGAASVAVRNPDDALQIAENLNIQINTTVTTGHAADVHVNQRSMDELGKLAKAEHPFEVLRKVVNGNDRNWAEIALLETGGMKQKLGAAPQGACTEWIVLELGVRKVFVYATESILIGRDKPGNTFTLRVPPDQMAAWARAYGQVSRTHCLIEPSGDCVRVVDGYWDEQGLRHRSKFGTFWNGEGLGEEPLVLEAGTHGKLSLGDVLPPPNPRVALRLEVLGCGGEACRTCPQARSLRRWCRDGRRSSVLLERTDGLQEWFVGLWGCVDLGAVDREYEGLVLFRQAGGFAWRCGKECGWLVPGQDAGTPLGTFRVRQKANWEYLANGGGNR